MAAGKATSGPSRSRSYTQLARRDRLPSLFVEADFESLPFELPTEWTDLPTFRSVSIRQGRQRLLDRTEVGTGDAWCWTTGSATTTRRCTRKSDRRTT